MAEPGDALDDAWEQLSRRFENLDALLIIAAEGGAIVRSLRRPGAVVPDMPGPMLASVCSQASKMKLGRVASTTAFYDKLCLVLVDAGQLVVAFILRQPANVGAILALAPNVVSMLELRPAA